MAYKKKHRLLIITDTFFPHWTGISKSIFNTAQALKTDFDITILTIAHEASLQKSEEISGINVIREPYLFIISRSHYSIRIIFKLLQIVRNFDTVLINVPSANVLFFTIISKLFGKKILIFYQGDLILPRDITNQIIEKIFDINTGFALFLSNKISTYTLDYAKNSRLLKHYLYKFTPLLLPIMIVKKPSKNTKTIRNSSNLKFGFGGRFVEEKGFDILFDAIPLIKKQYPDAKFYLAGPTHMPYENFFKTTQEIYKKIKKDIKLLGLLDNEGLLSFYNTIDFLIIPSRSDCFNMMQAEAMICGTPCISSNIPGLRYLIRETGFGVLFEKNNPIDLAQKVNLAVAKRKEIMLEYNNVLTVLEDKTNVEKIRNFITK